ncbi:PTS transporter subunit EIIC [Alkalithermobacter paradoxus]|uniref:Negative regulator of SacY activity n=1 Tax=Alkalithermobacter paradoxus TaxID=29349 RepID=A0A1V4I8H7_9FIRM|nr:negative regulator of SacY activity [[Clostridium] thermoalcaliphilum]
MDEINLSKEIANALGGEDNIEHFDICATRLRISLKDNDKADLNAIKKLEGVVACVFRVGQVHIILGTGLVSRVYDNLSILVNNKENRQESISKNNLFRKISSIFIPLIPALVGSGMIIGINNTLKNIGIISEYSEIYRLLDAFSSSVFIFLNILVGVSAAREFGSNQMLGGVVAGILIHPSLELVSGGIFAVLLVIFFMSYVEKSLRKIIPNSLDLILTPVFIIIITGLCTVYLLSPVGSFLTNSFNELIRYAFSIGKGMTGLLLGSVYSVLVTTGLHQGLNSFYLELLSTTGINPILPIIAMADTAQGGAALAVYIKSKNPRMKKIAINSIPVCLLGITEPVMFGCNLPLVKPFIGGIIGGAVGGLFVALMEVRAISLGLSAIPIISIIQQGYVIKYIIGFFIAFSVAFLATYILGFEDDIDVEEFKIK